jgi:hypothetical protein
MQFFRVEAYLQAPNHWDWDEGEEEVCCNVYGGIEDADILEDFGVVAFCSSG